MSAFGLYVKFRAQPGQRDALVARLLHAAELMQGVPGCEIYIVGTSPTEANVVWVTEVWRSQADHDDSLSLPDAQPFIEQTLPLMHGRPEQIETRPLGGKGLTPAQ
jgi:quinol monooxygenase YgiN